MPLSYLKELEKARLPLEVTDPDALRMVVVLQAALLIDAQIRSGSAAAPHGSATVEAITDRGWGMLDRLRARE
jgi:hypothetical protein